MMLLVVTALGAGVLLGLLFKVFALLPASSLCVLAAVANGSAEGRSFGLTIAGVILSVVCLQMGYLVAGLKLPLSSNGQNLARRQSAAAGARQATSAIKAHGAV
jgi:hypothetical protein